MAKEKKTKSTFSEPEHMIPINSKLVEDLDIVDKTAVNLATGIGKSVVLERVVYDNMDKNILVFVPRQTIKNQHLRSIEKYCVKVTKEGKEKRPKNVTISCYNSIAKHLDKSWDIIFADEYHHLGGEVWSRQMDELLRRNPNAKFIGTTATPIRSDGRNMADALFGHVSSEISMQDAISSELLPYAKFYGVSYDVEGLDDRINYFVKRSKFNDDEILDKLLVAIKHSAEHANKLFEFFSETIPENHGKYIIFCSSIEQMNIVMNNLDKWFEGKAISKYAVYHRWSDKRNARSLENFEEEDACNKLVFLLNINMIGEGYHFDDLDGIIVYRPTYSIIKYIQQIGRVMTINWKKSGKIPVIVDITNSIEDLQRCQDIIQKARPSDFGFGNMKTKIQFSIYKEDQDILDILSHISFFEDIPFFEIGFCHAEQYFRKFGNLMVPQNFICDDGFNLGTWICARRIDYKNGILSKDKIKRLESIGMVWDAKKESFEFKFKYAEEYFLNHGHLIVPQNFVCEDGFKLGQTVNTWRRMFRTGEISEYKIKRLESIGMVWNEYDLRFEKGFIHAERYFKEFGNLLVPIDYICPYDNFALGKWIRWQRSNYNSKRRDMPKERIKRLESIGMLWNVNDAKFEEGFTHAERYFKEFGNLLVPIDYVCPYDNYPLGRYIVNERQHHIRSHSISEDRIRIKRLESIGMIWDVREYQKEIGFKHAEAYFKEYGDLLVPYNYICSDGYKLYIKIRNVRKSYKEGKLPKVWIDKYESIGMDWNPKSDK